MTNLSMEEEAQLSPMRMWVEATVNGVRIVGSAFVLQQEWEAMTDEDRMDLIRATAANIGCGLAERAQRSNLLRTEPPKLSD